MVMRISTRTIFDMGSTQITSLSSAMARTQQQLSTGRKNLTAADDPIASARALEVTQSQSINTQFVTNRSNAKNFLSQEELAQFLGLSRQIVNQHLQTWRAKDWISLGRGSITLQDPQALQEIVHE